MCVLKMLFGLVFVGYLRKQVVFHELFVTLFVDNDVLIFPIFSFLLEFFYFP